MLQPLINFDYDSNMDKTLCWLSASNALAGDHSYFSLQKAWKPASLDQHVLNTAKLITNVHIIYYTHKSQSKF